MKGRTISLIFVWVIIAMLVISMVYGWITGTNVIDLRKNKNKVESVELEKSDSLNCTTIDTLSSK